MLVVVVSSDCVALFLKSYVLPVGTRRPDVWYHGLPWWVDACFVRTRLTSRETSSDNLPFTKVHQMVSHCGLVALEQSDLTLRESKLRTVVLVVVMKVD